MATAHIEVARGTREVEGRVGPKAAFEFYMGQSIPTARATQDEIRSAGNKKRQFEAYCAKFGHQFGPVNGNGAVRSEGQREDSRENGLSAEQEGIIEKLARKLGVSAKTVAAVVAESDEDESDEDEVEPIVATRISFPMAMALKRAANDWDVEFEITGKTGKGHTANYACTFDGEDLTPEEASEIIGEWKESRA